MTEYYKTDLSLYKIIDSKVYLYDYKLKDWKCYTYFGRQYLLNGYEYTQITLLDVVMLGVPE